MVANGKLLLISFKLIVKKFATFIFKKKTIFSLRCIFLIANVNICLFFHEISVAKFVCNISRSFFAKYVKLMLQYAVQYVALC
jgi:hypothetical protein